MAILNTSTPKSGLPSQSDSPTEYGGTMPFVQPPFAMTSWTAQTRESKISRTSYHYQDKAISGFIGTHQPAIWMGDYGYVTLMPELDDIKPAFDARKLPFRHSDETSTPYYYSVSMDAGSSRTIRTEITATEHCALFRFSYPPSDHSNLLVEATRAGVNGLAEIDSSRKEITGYNADRQDASLSNIQLPNFKGYFVVQISKPFSGYGSYQKGSLKPNDTSASGENVGAYATFSTTDHEVVQVRVGTSFISLDQARANLQKEIPDWNFDALKTALRTAWNQKLATLSVTGGTPDEVTEFYTALYHASLYPRLFSEHGRYYSAFDDKVHSGASYTAYLLWDTFRAENSLLTLIYPDRIPGMVQALLQDFQEGGWMPKWPNPSYTSIMVATHGDSIVAEAIDKGFKGFDYNLAYQAVYKDGMRPSNNDIQNDWHDRAGAQPYSAREGLTYYLKLGYVPIDKTARSTSCTLEGAYDDWCIAQVAKAVGKTDDYATFLRRAKNYQNVYDPATGWMEGRKSDGSWAPNTHAFTEGGQRQNSFTVFQDMPGLVKLMGGPDAFIHKLDQSSPDLSNEPGEHFPYLYDYAGLPSRAQSMIRDALLKVGYANTPAGLPGNDDCGQISAWWIFGALGFYPVNPASGQYMIGSPLFDTVAIHLANGKTFTVTADHNSPDNVYVQSATLNGASLNVPYITWDEIISGGDLTFEMGPTPSKWATTWSPSTL